MVETTATASANTSFEAMSRKPQETNAYNLHMNPIRREECVQIPAAKLSDAFGYSTQIRILIQPVLFQRSNPEMISILLIIAGMIDYLIIYSAMLFF